MEISFSFIIPVLNRPDEIRELLLSMEQLDFKKPFEVVIIEDGSSISSRDVANCFSGNLNVSYYEKDNSGPGDSRNYGMQMAKGNYFLILDSDVILPPDYLKNVETELNRSFTHCFGGPDAAHESFSSVQKAINYAMTSFFTTGGIRGNKKTVDKFQPRSFNMGLSAEAFKTSGGFGNIHPGEDPDLALRLQKAGYDTRLFPEAEVFHKRRIDWVKFYRQVYKFGLVRPILNSWHPESNKITYWFPTLFSAGLVVAVILSFFEYMPFLCLYVAYFIVIFIDASVQNKSVGIGFKAVWATLIQFLGYGFGFCRSTCYIRLLNKNPREGFPKLFFKNARYSNSPHQDTI